MTKTTRLYRMTRDQVRALQSSDYVFSTTERARPMCVIEVRQHNWVLVETTDGRTLMITGIDLRQCRCQQAGQYHWHAGAHQ